MAHITPKVFKSAIQNKAWPLKTIFNKVTGEKNTYVPLKIGKNPYFWCN